MANLEKLVLFKAQCQSVSISAFFFKPSGWVTKKSRAERFQVPMSMQTVELLLLLESWDTGYWFLSLYG